jgi:KipI family sensor histidine kinase inhibitor
MTSKISSFPRFSYVGDSALLLELGESLDFKINHRIHALDDWMEGTPLKGVQARVPAYTSLLVIYDPLQVTGTDVKGWMEEGLESCPSGSTRVPKEVEIAVCYGGEDGPDLAFVAEYHGLTPVEVVRRHTAQTYHVGMMGFTPGFAYLMGLDPDLATPRLSTPRIVVPAGSVGIAGEQTGVYPLESPGGWRLIGRTARTLFDPQYEPYFLLSPGDKVRFVAQEGGITP